MNASPQRRPEGFWQGTLRRLRRNRAAIAGLAFLVLLVALAVFAPQLTPYSYEDQELVLGATPPSLKHWMGTDVLGRDLLTRVLYGGRVSLSVGLCATFVSLLIGSVYGAVSGYLGGRTDALMMRVVDVLNALPFTMFALLVMAVFERSLLLLFAAIGAVQWLTMARIVRGQVLSVRNETFVRAAVVLGFGPLRIILRHILPNVTGPIVVYTTLTVPRVMLLEAFLSFLGLGVQPPLSSWGLLIKTGTESMETYPWLLIFPGLVLSITLFALNFLGDGLRDALDPRFTRGTETN